MRLWLGSGSEGRAQVMLSDPARPAETFEGGEFQTLEADGSMAAHPFGLGDALAFVSHKYHCVQPVRRGRRNVLILEFWPGEERACGHRCTRHWGVCDYLRTGAPESDPGGSTAPGRTQMDEDVGEAEDEDEAEEDVRLLVLGALDRASPNFMGLTSLG